MGCKNPYLPSSRVRKLTGHVKGTLCKYWNMCLLCDQALVTEQGLPKIIAYKWKLEECLVDHKANMQGRKLLYEEIIAVIDSLITPGEYFPEEVISKAEYLASELDYEALDHLVYQGF